jgi:hypothetical protein
MAISSLPEEEPVMQKLVTIGLSRIDHHGGTDLHLEDYFSEGWEVVSMTQVGAGSGRPSEREGQVIDQEAPGNVSGWLAVLLEKKVDIIIAHPPPPQQ